LAGVSLGVEGGEFVALTGPSGSGKSTLLSLLGTLDRPTSGRVLVDGADVFGAAPLHRLRRHSLGFVFQFHHLLPAMTLLENVEAPLLPLRLGRGERRDRARGLLDEVGLAHRAHFLPAHVSGGERQRAAVARALVNDPAVVLADEPTGNLDAASGRAVLELLTSRALLRGAALLVATHNADLAARADRVVALADGAIVGERLRR
ncbi:MAG: ABC transporter ATP-binding protein, partial [Deltaproteobacteria bacterium]|nr:ABC transporter ATP-binding protein [Deltaproteobacteria bacterium]